MEANALVRTPCCTQAGGRRDQSLVLWTHPAKWLHSTVRATRQTVRECRS